MAHDLRQGDQCELKASLRENDETVFPTLILPTIKKQIKTSWPLQNFVEAGQGS